MGLSLLHDPNWCVESSYETGLALAKSSTGKILLLLPLRTIIEVVVDVSSLGGMGFTAAES